MPVEDVVKLAGVGENRGELKIHTLDLPAKELLPCLCWDGKRLFALTRGGSLRVVNPDGFRQEKRLEVGKTCSWMSLSSSGLVLTLSDKNEVWIVSPDSLRVTKRLLVQADRVVSAPGTSLGFALDKDGAVLLDLEGNEQIGKVDGQFRSAAMTNNGMRFSSRKRVRLWCCTFGRATCKNRRDGPDRPGGGKVVLSDDGERVCLVVGEAKAPTVIYSTQTLQRDRVLDLVAFPEGVAFAPRGERLYAGSLDHRLRVFGPAGEKASYPLAGMDAEKPRQLLACAGRRPVGAADRRAPALD